MATTTQKPAAHDFSYLDRLEARAKAAPKRPYDKFCTPYDPAEFSFPAARKLPPAAPAQLKRPAAATH